jgi:hypothetical protein
VNNVQIRPNFDIARECRFEGEFDRCSEDEGAAFRQLQNTWTQFSGGGKRLIASTTIGGFWLSR